MYQVVFSSQDSPQCNYHPSCSRYGQQAISRYGLEGLLMAGDRLQRCNGMTIDLYPRDPMTGLGLDPIENHALSHHLPFHGLVDGPDHYAATESMAPVTTAPDRVPDHFTPANVLEFAEFLNQGGDYERAAGAPDSILCSCRSKASG